jgi:hypothetical protein
MVTHLKKELEVWRGILAQGIAILVAHRGSLSTKIGYGTGYIGITRKSNSRAKVDLLNTLEYSIFCCVESHNALYYQHDCIHYVRCKRTRHGCI